MDLFRMLGGNEQPFLDELLRAGGQAAGGRRRPCIVHVNEQIFGDPSGEKAQHKGTLPVPSYISGGAARSSDSRKSKLDPLGARLEQFSRGDGPFYVKYDLKPTIGLKSGKSAGARGAKHHQIGGYATQQENAAKRPKRPVARDVDEISSSTHFEAAGEQQDAYADSRLHLTSEKNEFSFRVENDDKTDDSVDVYPPKRVFSVFREDDVEPQGTLRSSGKENEQNERKAGSMAKDWRESPIQAQSPAKRAQRPVQQQKRTVFAVSETTLRKNGWDDAMLAVRANDISRFNLKCMKSYNRMNPMHAAVLCKNEDILEASIKKLKRPDLPNSGRFGQTPLHLAAIVGFTQGVRMLIKSRCSVDQTCKNDTGPTSALFLAAYCRQAGAVKELLSAGASKSGLQNGRPFLHYVRSLEVFQEVMQTSKIIPNPLRETTMSRLQNFISKYDNVAKLKKKGKDELYALLRLAKLEIVQYGEFIVWKKFFLLHSADREEIAPFILSSGLYKFESPDGSSLLHESVKSRDIAVTRSICGALKGAKDVIDHFNSKNRTPLHFAARFTEGNCDERDDELSLDLTLTLLDAGADINAVDSLGNTPLYYALMGCLGRGKGISKVSPTLKLFLGDKRTDFTIINVFGYSVLHVATKLNLVDAVKTILDSGLDPNLIGPQNTTAIFIAASKGFQPIIRLLLEAGADPTIKKEYGFDGISPLEIARKNRFFDIENLIYDSLKNKGKLNMLNGPKRAELTPMSPFVQSKHGVEEILCLDEATLRKISKKSSNMDSTEGRIITRHNVNWTYGRTRDARADVAVSERDWRTVRLFISSTFLDMKGEREHLLSTVLPLLRKRAGENKVSIVEVDLRWGITESASAAKTAQICLEQLSQCDLFVCFVGHRYGTVVDVNSLPEKVLGLFDPEFVKSEESRYTVPSSRGPNLKSMTELEVQLALNTQRLLHRSFYFRKSSPIEFIDSENGPISSLRDFIEESCRKTAYHVEEDEEQDSLIEYGMPKELGAEIADNIMNTINRVFPAGGSEDMLDTELAHHDRFLFSRIKSGFVKRGVNNELMQFCERDGDDEMFGSGGNGPMLVAGAAGSGKSAVLAGFVNEFKLNSASGNAVIVYHFVGASPAASRIRDVLERLCRQILRELNMDTDISSDRIVVPDDYEELIVCFNRILQRIPYTLRKLVLVIDALNQMDDTNDSQSLKWLPHSFPRGVRVVLSANEGSPALQALRRRASADSYGRVRVAELGRLVLHEQRDLVTEVLRQNAKSLTPAQMDILLNKEGVTSPLYLYMALDEMKTFADTMELSKSIKSLGATTQELFNQIISRLQREHGEKFVEDCFSFIEGSMHGLPEVELIDLLCATPKDTGRVLNRKRSKKVAAVNDPKWIRKKWLHVQAALDLYLKPLGRGGEGELDWFHRSVAKFLWKRFKTSIAAKHSLFADYYLRKCVKLEGEKGGVSASYSYADRIEPSQLINCEFHGGYTRALACLPYHLMRQGNTELTINVMCNLNFIQQKLRLGMGYGLLDEFQFLRFESTTAFKYSKEQTLKLRFFRKFVNSQIHVLAVYPEIVVQQALNAAGNDWVHEAATQIIRRNTSVRHSMLLNRFSDSDWFLMTLMAKEDSVKAIAIAPDYSFVALGCDSGKILIYAMPSGRLLETVEDLHNAEVSSLDVLMDETQAYLLLSADVAGNLKISDVYTKRVLSELVGHSGSVNAAKFRSGSSKMVASCGDDGKLRLWEREAGGGSTCTVRFTADKALNCLAWCCASEYGAEGVLFGGADCILRFAPIDGDVRNLGVDTTPEHLHTKRIVAVATTPGGRYGVSAGEDRNVKIWNMKTGNMKADLKGHNDTVTGVVADDDFVYSVSNDKSMRVWNLKLHICQSALQSHSHFINCIALSPKRDIVVTGSDDRTARLYSIADLKKAVDGQDKSHAHTMLVRGLACGSSGELVASGSWDKAVKLWPMLTVAKEEVTPKIVIAKHTKRVSSCAFTPDEAFLVTGGHDSTIRLFNVKSGKEIFEVREKAIVLDCDVASDGRRVAGALISNEVVIWDVMTRTKLSELYGHEKGASTVRFSHDEHSKLLVSSGSDGDVKIWKSADGQLLASLFHKAEIFSDVEVSLYTTTFSPDNTMVCSGGNDMRICVWRIGGSKHIELVRILIGHQNEVLASDWIDENHIVSGAADCTIRLWDVRTGECEWIIPTTGQVTSLVWNRKKRILICGDGMGNVLYFTLNIDK